MKKIYFTTALLLLLPALLAGQEPADAGMVHVENFYIDVYEYPNQQEVAPRVEVSWSEANALCAAQGKRLCTEREWQQAAAGSQNYPYGYGPTFESGRCNTPYLENGTWKRDRGTAPCGSYADCASDYGAYDMLGNVWEWTADRYVPNQDWQVVRGGSWFHNVNLARVDARYGRFLDPDYRLDLIGFRCCRSASPLEESSE